MTIIKITTYGHPWCITPKSMNRHLQVGDQIEKIIADLDGKATEEQIIGKFRQMGSRLQKRYIENYLWFFKDRFKKGDDGFYTITSPAPSYELVLLPRDKA